MGAFRNIAVVSSATGASRILGLVRDVCFFIYLGAGVWASAFVVAFTLPNLFRRLLGEGALASAIIPVFASSLEQDGAVSAHRFFNQVLTRLFLSLCVLCLLGILLFGGLSRAELLGERWQTAAHLAALVFPYVLFVCLAAVVGAGLNVSGRFAAAALSPVWLNLCMILALLLGGSAYPGDPEKIVFGLCIGVLAGGVLQLLLPAWDFSKTGWRPAFSLARSERLTRVWQLFLPGVAGAAILQVNMLVSRLLAFAVDEAGASILYAASRLMELPLGLFTVAVATVVYPTMARAVAREDEAGFTSAFLQGVRLVAAISFAAGVGLAVLAPEILTLLFQYGAFDQSAVRATTPVLIIYGLGLSFYSVATFLTRGLYAHENMRAPVRIALVCLGVNLGISLLLMGPFGVRGLALANVLTALVQCLLLWRALNRVALGVNFAALIPAFVKIAFAGLVMGVLCYLGTVGIAWFALPERVAVFTKVLFLVPLGVAAYGACLWLVRFEDTGTLIEMVRRRFRK